MMTPEFLIERAKSATGKGIFYWLGAGGNDPQAELPATATALSAIKRELRAAQQAELRAAGFDDSGADRELPTCDCSGYVCWVLRIQRKSDKPGYRSRDGSQGWVNTDSMWQDARTSQSLFLLLPAARVGCIVVHPSPGRAAGKRIPGHVGIVTQVVDGKASRVLHCSPKNSHGIDAIQETAADAFLAPMPRPNLYAWSREVAGP